MDIEPALVYGCMLDGAGGATALNWSEVVAWTPPKGLLWLHLDADREETRHWLVEDSGLSEITCESLLDQGTRPRCSLSPDGLLLILRGVNCNPGQDPEDMVALRMLFSQTRIITLRYRRVMAVQDIHEALAAGSGPTGAGDFLALVTDRIADRMGEVIAETEDRVDELEESLLAADTAQLREQLADVRRAAVRLRRYIAPQRDVLSRLSRESIAWIDEAGRTNLRETAERTARFVEDVQAAYERATVTQEELNHRLAEQMNRAMYTLSIVAAIFLPLSLVTGLLGINVEGIPGAHFKWAFVVVTAGLGVLAVLLVMLFKKIKWL